MHRTAAEKRPAPWTGVGRPTRAEDPALAMCPARLAIGAVP
jgi:hypothetical protein